MSKWKISHSNVSYEQDSLFKHIKDTMFYNKDDYEIGIGTDSQVIDGNTKFISVICVHKVGKGGFYYYKTEWKPSSKGRNSNKIRMFDEVANSISLAFEFEKATGKKAKVHVDASPSHMKEFSSSFSDQLKGYVLGCSFECLLKPHSYVASCIADKHSKKHYTDNQV